jgi:long-chain acyl-CoA synthetase
MPDPMDYPTIHATLTAPGQLFELEISDIRGVPTRGWKNAPRNLTAALAQGAAIGGGNDFLVLDSERVTHDAHVDLVERCASALSELGVTKGDRVAIAMRNYPEWSIAFFAAVRIGAVAAAINAFGTGSELALAIDDADARVVIADGERLERLAGEPGALEGRVVVGTRLDDRKGSGDLPPDVVTFAAMLEHPADPPAVDVEPDDYATIFYTSGTSSRPKGVLGTHRNICGNLMSMMFIGAQNTLREGASPSQRGPSPSLLSVPLFHATGCHGMLVGPAFFGGTVFFMRRWDPEQALEIIERERIPAFGGVPTMLWDLLHSPSIEKRDLTCLRTFSGAGAASPPELPRRIHELFPDANISTGYGMTETSSVVAAIGGRDYVARPDSVGVPLPMSELRIVDGDGNDVAEGSAGEIWIKSANVTVGYWRHPEETSETYDNGWIHTGDIGRLDDEGFLYVVDRAKDIVIRGGENIATLEVEAVLYGHEDVEEVVVFAAPHRTLGEEVAAVVRIRSDAAVTPDDLRAFAAERLAAHKVPTHVWLRESDFPRGDTGKILKRDLQVEYVAFLTQDVRP